MANTLLSPKDVEERFGLDRNTLLSWESQGLITPTKTSGGHRRYDPDQIKVVSNDLAVASEMRETAEMGYHELGVTGLKRQGGEVLEERLKELRGYSGRILKREMRQNDPVLGAMFFGISTAMRNPEWRVKPASDKPYDRKTAEFVESCMFDMTWDWRTQLAMIIEEMLEQGFSVNEVVFKRRLGDDPYPYVVDPPTSLYNDGKIGWRKWSPRPATSLASGNEWIFDENDGIQGINQSIDSNPYVRSNIRPIPIEKLLHFRTSPHPANSPEGQAIHRAAYVSWYRKTNIEEIEGIGIERDLAGIPVVYLGKGTTKRGPNSDFELAKDLVVNLRNDDQIGVVLPHQKQDNEGNGILLELLSSDSRRSYDTSEIIMRYNKLIAMSTLAQFLFLGMENVGSYALIGWQGDLFSLAISSYLDSIASVLNKYAVPKLVKLNGFSHADGYPELIPGAVGIPNLETFGKFVNDMVQQKIITVDDEFEQNIRQIAGLPPMSADIMGRDRTPVVPVMQPNNETNDQGEDKNNAEKEDLQKD